MPLIHPRWNLQLLWVYWVLLHVIHFRCLTTLHFTRPSSVANLWVFIAMEEHQDGLISGCGEMLFVILTDIKKNDKNVLIIPWVYLEKSTTINLASTCRNSMPWIKMDHPVHWLVRWNLILTFTCTGWSAYSTQMSKWWSAYIAGIPTGFGGPPTRSRRLSKLHLTSRRRIEIRSKLTKHTRYPVFEPLMFCLRSR